MMSLHLTNIMFVCLKCRRRSITCGARVARVGTPHDKYRAMSAIAIGFLWLHMFIVIVDCGRIGRLHPAVLFHLTRQASTLLQL